jgi:hypothetical protein
MKRGDLYLFVYGAGIDNVRLSFERSGVEFLFVAKDLYLLRNIESGCRAHPAPYPVPRLRMCGGKPLLKNLDLFVNCYWVDTWWQQYNAHLHTNSTQNKTMKTEYTERNIHNNKNA